MSHAQELFRALAESSPDGLWLIHPDGTTRYVNPAMAAMLGRDAVDLVGAPATDAVDASDVVVLERHLARLADVDPADPELSQGSTTLATLEGPLRWILISWRPLLHEGVLLGWLHRFAPYAGQPDSSPRAPGRGRTVASWEYDVATRVLSGSAALHTVLGLPPGAPLPRGAALIALADPRDHAALGESFRRAAEEGEDIDLVVGAVSRRGRVRRLHVLGTTETGPDGGTRLRGTVHDVTDARLAEDEADNAARRLRLQQQVASLANRATTLADAVRLASAVLPVHAPGWCAVALYDTSGPSPVLQEVHDPGTTPDPALAAEARRRARLVVGAPGPGSQHGPETHSLVALPVLVHSEVVAVVEVLGDEVPPDGASRMLLDQVGTQLGLVATREHAARELAGNRDEAVRASRLKSEFLATMSHEIRTPMNGVVGLTELLLGTDLDAQQRHLTEMLRGAGLDLLAIINDTLDLAKVEAGKLELEVADLDVRSVLERAASLVHSTAADKGLALVLDCAPDVPALLRGDATRLGQVIANLLSNAVRFTEQGDIVVSAALVPTENPDAEEVVLRLSVRDTGVGIAEDALPSIFDAFTQADLSTTRRHGGTGLGLAISRQLVEAMGGELGAESRVGEGSTFTFTVRLARADAPTEPDPAAALAGRRVLVAVAHAATRAALLSQLTGWGVCAETATDAEHALAVLHHGVRTGTAYDAVLVGSRLPDADGATLARRVAAHRDLRDLAVVLLTGDPREPGADATGVTAVLGAPVSTSALRDTLLTHLGEVSRDRDTDPDAPRERRPLDVSVLVVEDNPVNQMVATGILASLGARVQVAEDGRAALAALTAPGGDHGIDAVLMDCRMPVMDGFEATRRVRAAEAPGRRVPIIAMTASAVEGERERCLAAGMDDFLTKPVDPAALERVLRRWTVDGTPLAEPSPAEESGAPEGDAAAPVLDPTRVRMLDELVKDGVSFFDRTARSFMSRIEEQLVAIHEAIDSGEAMTTFTASHLVKGSALNLGLPRVAAAAARIEARADSGATTGYQPLTDALRREVDLAVAVLAEAVQ